MVNRRACLLLAAAQMLTPVFGRAQSAEKPLASLPYTPALDAGFVDRAADPCVDFYQFACGNWNRLNPIPPDQARWDVYSKLHDDNLRFLWGMLEEAAQPRDARTANEQKIGDYFAACMDQAAVENAPAPLRCSRCSTPSPRMQAHCRPARQCWRACTWKPPPPPSSASAPTRITPIPSR